jgi:hypothetical protein
MKNLLSESTMAYVNGLGHAFDKLEEDLKKLHPSIYADGMSFHNKEPCKLAEMVNTWINYALVKGNDAALQHICRYYNLDPLAVKAGAKDLTERSGENWKVTWADGVENMKSIPIVSKDFESKVISTKHSNIQTGEPQGDVSSGLEATLQQRGQTHGDYTDHARISQELKATVAHELDLRKSRGQPPLEATARESIDMILHKIARVIAGEWDEPDHWQDIAGYATITEKRIKK